MNSELELLQEEYLIWCNENGFADIEGATADMVLSVWGNQLEEGQKKFLFGFISSWFAVADVIILERLEYCQTCDKWFPKSGLQVCGDLTVCAKCAAKVPEQKSLFQESLFN